MSPVDNIERRIEQLHLSTRAGTDKCILDDAFVALRKGLQMPQPGVWRLIATSRMARPIAAAAVILIAIGLFLSMPARDADTVEGFYSTLAATQNICVSTFQPGQTSPQQQVWTSQSLKVRLFKTGAGDQAKFALEDIGKNIQMTLYLSTVRTEPLTEQKLLDLEKSVTPAFGLAPFFDAKDVPDNARWHRASDPTIAAIIPGCVVYDLTWVLPGMTVQETSHKKWRVFVDAKTHLPRKTEFYARSESESDYRLESFAVVTYPSESEIRELVANTFGQPGSRMSEPEHIGTPGIDR